MVLSSVGLLLAEVSYSTVPVELIDAEVEGVTGGISGRVWGTVSLPWPVCRSFCPGVAPGYLLGAQAHQLLSACHRQLYVNIHTIKKKGGAAE